MSRWLGGHLPRRARCKPADPPPSAIYWGSRTRPARKKRLRRRVGHESVWRQMRYGILTTGEYVREHWITESASHYAARQHRAVLKQRERAWRARGLLVYLVDWSKYDRYWD